MDEIRQTLEALSQFAPTSEARQDSTRVPKVWLQLVELFGKAFIREHGDEPGPLWSQAIHKLRDDQIATGLANLANDDLSFPPNLSMFVSACKRVEVHQPTRTTYLPAPQMDRRVRAANLTLMKILGTHGPVSDDVLRCLVAMKNEFARDWPVAMTEEHIIELRKELVASL